MIDWRDYITVHPEVCQKAALCYATELADRQHLRSLLVEGGESLPTVTADNAFFETLRAGVRRHSEG
jgi:hypothetical protein